MYVRVGAMCGAALLAAMPAMAQQARLAAEIVLVQGPSQGQVQGYRVLGNVRAEIHQKSMIAKTPARELADQQLRAEAAKLGADAVVEIKYENNSPMFSKKGFIAVGKAVKFETAVAAVAVAPPVIATPAPQAPPVQQPVAAPPVVTAAAIPLPPESAPKPPVPGPRPPTPQALIVLSEDNMSRRAQSVLGIVRAEAHPTSLFPRKSAREMLEDDLRAKAFALGADAVISIEYESNSPMTSKKGSHATGVAVKFW